MGIVLNRFLLLMMVFLFNQCQSISWKVELQKANQENLQLVNRFKSFKELEIIFDRKALSYVCYYGEKIDLTGEQILNVNNFDHSQIILENKNGQRRLYSNVFFENGEIKNLPDENCMFDWYEYLKLSWLPQKNVVDIPYLSDLKVEPKDKKIRMIYVFKATQKQKQKGYSNLVLKSNWINLE